MSWTELRAEILSGPWPILGLPSIPYMTNVLYMKIEAGIKNRSLLSASTLNFQHRPGQTLWPHTSTPVACRAWSRTGQPAPVLVEVAAGDFSGPAGQRLLTAESLATKGCADEGVSVPRSMTSRFVTLLP